MYKIRRSRSKNIKFSFSLKMSDQMTIVKGCTDIDQLTKPTSNDNFKMAFFYNPPKDTQFYHITFELSKKNIDPENIELSKKVLIPILIIPFTINLMTIAFIKYLVD